MIPRYIDPNRMLNRAGNIFLNAGQPVLLHRVASAVPGLAMGGFGSAIYYRDQVITALFSPIPPAREAQAGAGMVIAADFMMTTRESIQRTDQVIWGGNTFRVEGEAVNEPLPGLWYTPITRLSE